MKLEDEIYTKLFNNADNCFDKPHTKLDSKARAVYSSATMIYNLLGNEVNIDGKKYQVEKADIKVDIKDMMLYK